MQVLLIHSGFKVIIPSTTEGNLRINWSSSSLWGCSRKPENDFILCLQKTFQTSFATLLLHLLAVFHIEQPPLWDMNLRDKVSVFMYDFFPAHNTSLCNFIYHGWAALTVPISLATELRAAKNKKTQISRVKRVLYHLSRLLLHVYFCVYMYLWGTLWISDKTFTSCSDIHSMIWSMIYVLTAH